MAPANNPCVTNLNLLNEAFVGHKPLLSGSKSCRASRQDLSGDTLFNSSISELAAAADSKISQLPPDSKFDSAKHQRRRRPKVGNKPRTDGAVLQSPKPVRQAVSNKDPKIYSQIRFDQEKISKPFSHKRSPGKDTAECQSIPLKVFRDQQQVVLKHLAGQYEYIIAFPESNPASRHESSLRGTRRQRKVFGCNVVNLGPDQNNDGEASADCSSDTYTFLATALDEDSTPSSTTRDEASRSSDLAMAAADSHQQRGDAATLSEVNGIHTDSLPSYHASVDGQAPVLASERSPVPEARIEDSLEELDDLEDQLEAVGNFTPTRDDTSRGRPNVKFSAETSAEQPDSASTQRSPETKSHSSSQSKPAGQAAVSLQRNVSVTSRDKTKPKEASTPMYKGASSLSQQQSTATKPLASKPTAKSTKQPTKPNFELPGEAVARRLKEQREARQAQQAEAQKAQLSPPKPKPSKLLTRPTFELPGEAISRRKREVRDARLRAQEEEERRRREFKARPIRQNRASVIQPRDTLTSRVRQNKDAAGTVGSVQNTMRHVDLADKDDDTIVPHRGRASFGSVTQGDSRGTSVSAGSLSGVQSTVSTEDAAVQKSRGREIYQRDNSFVREWEQDKHDRESVTRLAREQAAERSRTASREWAEKQRRREQVAKERRRESLQSTSPAATATATTT